MTIDCTKKIFDLCHNLRAIEETISTEKENIAKNKMDIIVKYEELLDNYFCEISASKDPKLNDVVILAESFMSMSFIKLPFDASEQEHLYIARYFVLQSLTLLKDKELNSRVILTAMSTLNIMSDICIKLRNEELSLQYLNKALDLYIIYTKGQDDFPAPINTLHLVGLETLYCTQTNSVYLLNKMFMETLKILIMLKCNIKHLAVDMEKITTLMHKLLKKQLEDIPQSIDYVSWSTEAIRLAEYFSLCDRFVECKNHLSLASVIITRFYNNCCKIDAETSAEENLSLYCQYKSTISIIDACWVKYGLALLFLSRKRLLNREEQDNIMEVNRCKSEPSTAQSVKQLLMFPCIEKEYEEFIHITEENYITNYDEAKRIFVNILQLLNKIKSDKFVLAEAEVRVEVTQYISRAYKYLAFYVHDKVNYIKLQKRRIDILEDCLTSLNEEDDIILRTIIGLELALINSIILNTKFESIEEYKPSEKELVEINQLVEKSSNYLQFYNDNSKLIDYALKNKLIDESYQVISTLNVQNSLRKIVT